MNDVNLIEIHYEGELVLLAPIQVLDREKARAAILGCADQGSLYGVDGGTVGMLLRATSETLSDGKSVGLYIEFRKE